MPSHWKTLKHLFPASEHDWAVPRFTGDVIPVLFRRWNRTHDRHYSKEIDVVALFLEEPDPTWPDRAEAERHCLAFGWRHGGFHYANIYETMRRYGPFNGTQNLPFQYRLTEMLGKPVQEYRCNSKFPQQRKMETWKILRAGVDEFGDRVEPAL